MPAPPAPTLGPYHRVVLPMGGLAKAVGKFCDDELVATLERLVATIADVEGILL